MHMPSGTGVAALMVVVWRLRVGSAFGAGSLWGQFENLKPQLVGFSPMQVIQMFRMFC